MRIRIAGAGDAAEQRLAALIAGGGWTLAPAGAPYDLLLTLAPATSARLELDRAAGSAWVDGRRVRLTRIEAALLGHLLDRGRPVARGELLAAVWGYRFDPGTNLVAVHMSRMRAKLGAEVIGHGADGYALWPAGGAGPTGEAEAQPSSMRRSSSGSSVSSRQSSSSCSR